MKKFRMLSLVLCAGLLFGSCNPNEGIKKEENPSRAVRVVRALKKYTGHASALFGGVLLGSAMNDIVDKFEIADRFAIDYGIPGVVVGLLLAKKLITSTTKGKEVQEYIVKSASYLTKEIFGEHINNAVSDYIKDSGIGTGSEGNDAVVGTASGALKSFETAKDLTLYVGAMGITYYLGFKMLPISLAKFTVKTMMKLYQGAKNKMQAKKASIA